MKKILLIPSTLTLLTGSIPLMSLTGCNNQHKSEEWGDEAAHIIFNGNIKKITNLVDSKICSSGNEDIVCDDGKTFPRSEFNFEIHLNPNLESIDEYFLKNCKCFNHPLVLPNGIKKIPQDFLRGCSKFNSTLTLPSDIIEIGNYFLQQCELFDKEIMLPSKLTKIGLNFLYDCKSFNQNISLPNSLSEVDEMFMASCDGMSNTININDVPATAFKVRVGYNLTLCVLRNDVPAYIDGITIDGTEKNAFLERFPNSLDDPPPYRNLK